jgi:hypothetical protein
LNSEFDAALVDAAASNPFHRFSHQHTPNDRIEYVTPEYEARIAQVVAGTAGSLALAPAAPTKFAADGDALKGVTVSWMAPAGEQVKRYVIAARATSENFYRARIAVSGPSTTASVSAAQLGLAPGESFFISVASVDSGGHESLFVAPEVRCDGSGCAVPPGAADSTLKK